METINVKKVIDAPVEKVWESWDDFGNIYKFNPGINASRLLGEDSTGIGAVFAGELCVPALKLPLGS